MEIYGSYESAAEKKKKKTADLRGEWNMPS